MASEPPARAGRRATADHPGDRRGWLSHGLAALAISALGLAIAGSVSLTTNAQPTTGLPAETTAKSTLAQSAPLSTDGLTVPGAAPQRSTPAVTATGPLAAFNRGSEATTAQPGQEVRSAVIKERAAQRAEDLSKTDEEVSRAVLDESSKARGADLAAADRATRQQAVVIAQERLRKAIAARIAAESARQQTEAGTPTGTFDPSTIPTGTGSSSPVPGAVIGAHFGQYGLWSRYHTGLDFRASYGTPIRAVTAGIVLYAGNSGDWAGNHVAIQHAGGYTSMSSHMSSMAVRAGQTVQAGQIIGYVGQTGRAFGAHLHFEIYPPGVKYGDVYKAINPVPWLNRQGVQTH